MLSDHFQELGADFREEIERRAADAKLIMETAVKYGVQVDMLWKPSTPIQSATWMPENSRDNWKMVNSS